MKNNIVALYLILLAAISTTAIAGNTWITDFEEAKKSAADRHLPILAYFSGSDWSNDCMRFDMMVLQTKVFQEYARSNLVLFQADLPRKNPLPEKINKQNIELRQKYGISKYPSVLLLDYEGKLIATKNYEKSDPAIYVNELRSLIKR